MKHIKKYYYFENLKSFDGVNNIIDDLKDLLYDISDDGFETNCSRFFVPDTVTHSKKMKCLILVYIYPSYNNKININMINNIDRIINYMNTIGYNLGSKDWFKNNFNNLRISFYGKLNYKTILFEELKKMIDLEFNSIELCFDINI